MPDFCQDCHLAPLYTSWCPARVVCGHVDTTPILWGSLQEKQSVGGQPTETLGLRSKLLYDP